MHDVTSKSKTVLAAALLPKAYKSPNGKERDMKDLITILMIAVGMVGAFMYLLIGTFPPLSVSVCIIALMCLNLVRGLMRCR